MSQWESHIDPKTGNTFYFDRANNKTTWNRPPELSVDLAPPPLLSSEGPPPMLSSVSKSPHTSPRKSPRNQQGTSKPLPDATAWYEVLHVQTNKHYYFQPSSRTTTWTKPSNGKLITGPEAAEALAILKQSSKKSLLTTKKLTSHNRSMSVNISSSGTNMPASNTRKLALTPQKRRLSGELPHASVAGKSSSNDSQGKTQPVPGCPNWFQLWDSKWNRYYFVNKVTKERSWTKPTPANSHQRSMSTQPSNTTVDHLVASRPRAGSRLYGSTATRKISPQQIKMVKLPSDIQGQIKRFQLDGYASKFFRKQKTGFFRRDVPAREILKWSNELLEHPILKLNDEKMNKLALKCFKIILSFCGDLSTPVKPNGKTNQALFILNSGYKNAQLRDEIFIQLIKQTTSNPSSTSEEAGWQILSLCAMTFPPSKNFENYLLAAVHQRQTSGSVHLKAYASYSLIQLNHIIQNGARPTIPPRELIKSAPDLPFLTPLLGVSLEAVMEGQKAAHPNFKFPFVLYALAEGLRERNGLQTEGVFRVPGDIDEISMLALHFQKGGNSVPKSFRDPHVLAGLFKQFLRDLPTPLIPMNQYDNALKAADDSKRAKSLFKSLPQLNQETGKFVLEFLSEASQPANRQKSKMGVSNLSMVFGPCFLRCPSANPSDFLNNQQKEQFFLSNLISTIGGGK